MPTIPQKQMKCAGCDEMIPMFGSYRYCWECLDKIVEKELTNKEIRLELRKIQDTLKKLTDEQAKEAKPIPVDFDKIKIGGYCPICLVGCMGKYCKCSCHESKEAKSEPTCKHWIDGKVTGECNCKPKECEHEEEKYLTTLHGREVEYRRCKKCGFDPYKQIPNKPKDNGEVELEYLRKEIKKARSIWEDICKNGYPVRDEDGHIANHLLCLGLRKLGGSNGK